MMVVIFILNRRNNRIPESIRPLTLDQETRFTHTDGTLSLLWRSRFTLDHMMRIVDDTKMKVTFINICMFHPTGEDMNLKEIVSTLVIPIKS